MKLHILSDLHTEFADFVPPETDAETIILAGDIGVGVDGHTHDPCDYELFQTRVVCNPRGYPGEHGRGGFKPELTVTV